MMICLLLILFSIRSDAQEIDSSLLSLLQNELVKPGDAVPIPFISYEDIEDYDGENLINLNTILAYLKDRPNIRVQLANYMDCRGDEAYNLKLSQLQAAWLAKWFVKNGVVEKQITPMGYGETKPIINCDCADCTEEQHFTNRRLEVILISSAP
ncbi:MAG: OmpA family protein [Saprospiraceae bacterium]|nr:OmpA family protein [Lewinella sp.]